MQIDYEFTGYGWIATPDDYDAPDDRRIGSGLTKAAALADLLQTIEWLEDAKDVAAVHPSSM